MLWMGFMRGKNDIGNKCNIHYKKIKKKKYKHEICMNMTTLMWFAAANIKCGQSPSLTFMTVPYICKTKHAYNTTATEETPQKLQ